MNIHIKDGISNLQRSSRLIDPDMSSNNVQDATLYFSFGMERLCKGLLYEINPALILATGRYDDLARLCYLDRVVDKAFINANKDKSVQSAMFSELLTRSFLFSNSCLKNKAILSNLKDSRNILAHQNLDKFNVDDTRKWLLGVYHPVVSSLALELALNLDQVFGTRGYQLQEFSVHAKHMETVEKRVNGLITHHRDIWEGKQSPNQLALAERMTNLDIHQPRKSPESCSYEEHECPACGNTAVLEIEPDFDYADGHAYVTSVYPSDLHCYYCGFKVDDHEDISFLGLDNWWQ